MKCTECSRHIDPIVVLDIDGTLGQYHQHFAQFCWNYWNMDPRDPEDTWNGYGEFEDYIGVDKASYREAKLAYRQGGMKRLMPLYSGATHITNKLGLAGAEVWLATTRPWMRHDSTDPDTRHWLHKHGIYFDYLIYDEDKYGKLAQMVDPERVVMVLEDLGEQFDMAKLWFAGAPVMIARAHNLFPACGRVPVAASLAEALTIGLERIDLWKRQHLS